MLYRVLELKRFQSDLPFSVSIEEKDKCVKSCRDAGTSRTKSRTNRLRRTVHNIALNHFVCTAYSGFNSICVNLFIY
jgi:hypothetical protein